MKKIYVLSFALLSAALTFGQGKVAGAETSHWDRIESSNDRSEDTLAPASFADPCITNGFALVGSSGGGYVSGINSYGDLAKGERYPFSGATCSISGFLVWYGAKESVSGTTQIVGSVTGKNGSTILGTSAPHTVSAIDTTSAGAAGWYEYTLSSPVTVTDTFFVWVAWTGGTDTVGIVHTVDPCGNNAYERWSDASMYAFNDGSSWGLDVDLAMLPLVNNLGYTGIFDTQAAEFGVYNNGEQMFITAVAADVTVRTITLHDISGRIIKEWQITGAQLSNYALDINDVPAGNYIVSMKTSTGNYAQKMNIR